MPDFVLVAHGSPSEPLGADAALAAIAAHVAPLVPGHEVRSATLALPGALDAAVAGLSDPVIYPFLMAEGWFTRTELPRRLAEIGVTARILPPFGLEPALTDLALSALPAGTAEVILVAHGARRPGPARDSALDLVRRLEGAGRFARVLPAFLEEAPFLADVAAEAPDAVCLPFFALRAGHVAGDIPAALDQGGFRGQLLPALGEMAEVPALIARSLRTIAERG